jgi:hypothetical protein
MWLATTAGKKPGHRLRWRYVNKTNNVVLNTASVVTPCDSLNPSPHQNPVPLT